MRTVFLFSSLHQVGFVWVAMAMAMAMGVVMPIATALAAPGQIPQISLESRPVMPATRWEGESFPDAFARHAQNTLGSFRGGPESAMNVAKPLTEFAVTQVQEWDGTKDLLKAFQYVRDRRFLPDPADPKFLRRSTWLFPDDGCYARAALASQNLADEGHVRPSKIFLFGNLRASTPNAPGGSVSWWYHVAAAFRVGEVVFVLDPAVEPQAPLSLKDWVDRMGGKGADPWISACHPTTYDPNGPCFSKDGLEKMATRHQGTFLMPEWERLLELGRRPQVELRDQPPWSGSLHRE